VLSEGASGVHGAVRGDRETEFGKRGGLDD
jgi:hypothetical protein